MQSIKTLKTTIKSPIIKDKKYYLYNFFKKEDLNYGSTEGYHCFIIPTQYYIWKGINLNDEKNKNVNIEDKDSKKILDNISSYFFADKETASLYGSKKGCDNCVDLQFKIVKDLVLMDISDINTIITLFKYLRNLKYEELKENELLFNDYNNELLDWNKSMNLKKKYPTEELFFEKKWKVWWAEQITNTLGNYEPKYVNGKVSSPKTPKKVERKSDDFFDKILVDLICTICKKKGINGWIYFKQDDNEFHDEIMICDAHEYIEYIDYHKI